MLGFIKSNLGGGDFGQLAEKIPGLSDLADNGDTAKSEGDKGGGGLLGGVIKMASAAIGGEAGHALDLTRKLTESGLDVGKFAAFGTMLVNFIRGKVGEGMLEKILSQVPALKNLMGG